MRTTAIVICNEFFENEAKVPFVHRNDVIPHTPGGWSQRVVRRRHRFWGLDRCFQHSHSEIVQHQIERRRKDRIVIVNDEPVRMDVCENFSELLHGPFCRGMVRDITVQNSPRADFHRYEHIQNPKGQRDGYEEVTGDDRFRLVPNESVPVLIVASATRTLSIQVLPDGSR